MIQFWILFLFFTCFCAGVESESEYDDYYEYYDEKEQKISAEWKTLATEMFEGMSYLITVYYKNYNYFKAETFFFEVIWLKKSCRHMENRSNKSKTFSKNQNFEI